MLTHRHIATAATALTLIAAAPAGAAATDTPPEPVVNWISPVTGQDMRTENPHAVQPPAPVGTAAAPNTPVPTGGNSPLAPIILVSAAALAALSTAVHRRRATRVTAYRVAR